MKKLIAVWLSAALLAGLAACGRKEEPREGTDATGLYELRGGEAVIREAAGNICASDAGARVFYEIFVGSFSDSDGDGTGDLRGIIERMDYLNDGDPASGLSLGVEGIWLTPVFASPSYHKYDVTDYHTIDPAFGTMDDLRELIALCHERDVRLILDLPINHTGSRNAWFVKFRSAHAAGDASSPFYDYYCWYRGECPAPDRTWQRIPGTDEYYECNFSPDMPELDLDNPAVRAALLDLACWYLDLGVDGFRFDAAKYIYFGEDGRSAAFWEWYTGQLRAVKPDVYTVAEVWDSAGVMERYIPATNCFDFTAAQHGGIIAQAVRQGDAGAFTGYVERTLGRLRQLSENARPVFFVSNHDMDRAAGYLSPAGGDMQMAANLYILSPGSPFIYYGEELGMFGSRGGADTDANRRLAMLWGDGDTVRDPPGSTYRNQADTSAAEQKRDGGSLYSHYKRLLQLRRANPEIARGEYRALELAGTGLGGFVSELDGQRVCVVHNAADGSLDIPLEKLGAGDITGVSAYIGAGEAALADGKLTVGPRTTAILR